MLTRETITVGRQRFRIGPWRSGSGVALLSLPPRSPRPSEDELLAALAAVKDRGYSSVLTSALDTADAAPFGALGFEEYDRLHVLVHDMQQLERLQEAPHGIRLRRARRGDRDRALALDGRAFPALWQLDTDGLADAESATPSSRFRVAEAEGRLVGYAVTGRGGDSGFLQRLATDPDHQRRGVAAALVRDCLQWCLRRRCAHVYVNTQVANASALALYRKLGFRTTENDLVVLSWSPG